MSVNLAETSILFGQTGYAATNLAPALNTTRLTYTVPTGKKTIVEHLFCSVERTGAATTANWQQLYWQFGGSLFMIAYATILSNVIGTQKGDHGGPLVMNPGNSITLISVDTSTGGAGNYYSSINYLECTA